MATPRLLLGTATTARLLLADDGWSDNGMPYNVSAVTDRVAPAGVAGEIALAMLYLAVAYEHTLGADVPIRVQAIVDGRAIPAVDVVLVGTGAREQRILEIPVEEKFPVTVPGYATLAGFAPRGAWAQIRVETRFVGAGGFVMFESVELEFDVVREAKTEGANP